MPKHDNFVTDIYFDELDKIFKIISACEQNIYNIDELINNEICHSGLRGLINSRFELFLHLVFWTLHQLNIF